MKNRYTKRVLAIIMAVITVFSVTTIATTNVSAESNKTKYHITINNPQGPGNGFLGYFKILGTNSSTKWITYNDTVKDYEATDVGDIVGISVMTDKYNGWYPNYINVSSSSDRETFYCGTWLNHYEIGNFYKTDKVFKLNIKTGNDTGSGTDQNIYVKLYDQNNVVSKEINASDVQQDLNAFEKGSDTEFYIRVPENFDKLTKIEISLDGSLIGGSKWLLESVSAISVSGYKNNQSVSKTVNEWYDKGDRFVINF